MTGSKTLLQLAGADLSPSKMRNASLVLIDLQNEYVFGPLALPGVRPAIANAERLGRRLKRGDYEGIKLLIYLVEPGGFEPPASAVRLLRSPN